jgi:S1-C subfamily serine protease
MKTTTFKKYFSTLQQIDELKPSGMGSGAVIGGKTIISASHVLGGKPYIIACGKIFEAKVIYRSKWDDIAVLETKVPHGLAPLPLNFSKSRLGESVYSISYPEITYFGTSPKFSKGHIFSNLDHEYMASSLNTYDGSSGAPVLNSKNQILGIITGTYSKENLSNELTLITPIRVVANEIEGLADFGSRNFNVISRKPEKIAESVVIVLDCDS